MTSALHRDDRARHSPNPRFLDAAYVSSELVRPLLEFRNFGVKLPHNWTTVVNSAEFGTDYYTRTAVAKSNIFINRPAETRYFYQDLDAKGERLNGATARYTVTFKQIPPVKGFWSITLYDKYHFLAPNALDRFALGTRSKHLRYEPDGSLIIYVQKDRLDADKVSNWLPASLSLNPGRTLTRSRMSLPTIGSASIFDWGRTSPIDGEDSVRSVFADTVTSRVVVTSPTWSVKLSRTVTPADNCTSV